MVIKSLANRDRHAVQTLSPCPSPKTFDRKPEMTSIKQEDLIQSVADAFQYISYYHPLDFITALGEA